MTECDIAKQRWEWVCHERGRGFLNLKVDDGYFTILDFKSTPYTKTQQVNLLTAAPELADKARALLRGIHKMLGVGAIKPDGFYDMVEVLDNAGIKHCWYGDETEKKK